MVTIQEVARAAGVSTATISRYLAGTYVRAEESIARAISDLGYRPSLVAQTLRSGRHHAIAVIVPDVTNPFFSALVKGIEQQTRRAGFQVLLGNSDEDPAQESDLLETLARRADGIIIAPVVEEGRSAANVTTMTVPTVLVDRDVHADREFDRVIVDNATGAELAVDYLALLGHTRIATISGPLSSTPGRGRHEGFLTAMAARDLPTPEEYRPVADFREQGGHRAMRELWSLTTRPTAVVVANNLMTFGALSALRDLHANVPDDISVVGFDDHPLAPLLNPPLTVLRRDEQAQGATAAALLLGRLDGDDGVGARNITLPIELIVRGSSAPPAIR